MAPTQSTPHNCHHNKKQIDAVHGSRKEIPHQHQNSASIRSADRRLNTRHMWQIVFIPRMGKTAAVAFLVINPERARHLSDSGCHVPSSVFFWKNLDWNCFCAGWLRGLCICVQNAGRLKDNTDNIHWTDDNKYIDRPEYVIYSSALAQIFLRPVFSEFSLDWGTGFQN